MTQLRMSVLALALLAGTVLGQDALIYEAEEVSGPANAWQEDVSSEDKWNLWSTDVNAEEKWSGGVVLQSPKVMENRESGEEGAPVLHTVIEDVPGGNWDVRIKHGRALAASVDGEEWIDLSKTGGLLGTFEVTDGRIEFWVDDRFALEQIPGYSYYDTVTVSRALPREMGVLNGDFEATETIDHSGWSWFSRTGEGSVSIVSGGKQGERCAHIEHHGERDYAFSNRGRLDVESGEVWTATGWVKCEETDGIRLAIVALRDGETIRWDIGSDGTYGTEGWTKLRAMALVPHGCNGIYPRFVGTGDVIAWVDAVKLEKGEAPAERPPKPKVDGWATRRIEENMGRGLVAMPTEGGVYLSWRLLGSDPRNVGFHVYCGVGRMRPERITEEPITETTDFFHEGITTEYGLHYSVEPVAGEMPAGPSGEARIAAGAEPKPYRSIDLDGDHTFQKCAIADLNGDGKYDFVLKQPNTNIDPYRAYWRPSEGTYKIEAYLHDGTFLWRNDLGWAIERGIWYSPYVVWDLDGDGKAEVAVKTGEGDPRDEDGRVRSGPEYLSIWDGQTGEERARVAWPSREGFGGYNVASRNQMGIAYLDGKTPCLLAARGTYGTMKLVAYQYHDGELEELWRWDNRGEPAWYRGQGAHFMHAGDVDDDGRDEVVLGSCVIDDNGDGLWSTGLGHPDHCYLGDINPMRPGLEIYYGIEPPHLENSVCEVDAKTGEILWGIDERTWHVHASGLCSDFDALHPGMECYSGEKEMPEDRPHRWLHTCDGELLATEEEVDLGLSPRAVYWDADPQRELLRGSRIFDFQGDVHTDQIEGSYHTWADILGDWREEIITSVPGELRIYTTTIPAEDRRACLMEDPIYRRDVAHLAMGYPQPPMTSSCIGQVKPAMGIRLPQRVAIGQTVEGRLIVVAGKRRGIAGTVGLKAPNIAIVEPRALEVDAPAGGSDEVPFTLTVSRRPAAYASHIDLWGVWERRGEQLQTKCRVRIADEPLDRGTIVQAEDFVDEGGGEVQIRDDKVGASEKCFSHWDDDGHWLQWEFDLAAEGQYVVVVRYCAPHAPERIVAIEGGEEHRQSFAATGGYSGTTNDWAHGPLKKAEGAGPRVYRLSAGKHSIKMTNCDGQGMNVDYIAVLEVE